MGGSHFALHGLDTPRMTTEEYENAIAKVIEVLRRFYADVRVSILAPEKTSHGDLDVDVFVAEQSVPSLDEVQRALRAVATSAPVGLDGKWYFALPWWYTCGDVSKEESHGSDQCEGRGVNSGKKHVQLDLKMHHTPEHLEYALFKTAHGDLTVFWGAMLKPYGLVLGDGALYLKISELEDPKLSLPKNKRRMVVSSEPEKILDFLGVEGERLNDPFETKHDLCMYAVTCRFFNPENVPDFSKRTMKRPLIEYYVDIFLPEYLGQNQSRQVGDMADCGQAEIMQSIVSTFGEKIRMTYERTRDEALEQMEDVASLRQVRIAP